MKTFLGNAHTHNHVSTISCHMLFFPPWELNCVVGLFFFFYYKGKPSLKQWLTTQRTSSNACWTIGVESLREYTGTWNQCFTSPPHCIFKLKNSVDSLTVANQCCWYIKIWTNAFWVHRWKCKTVKKSIDHEWQQSENWGKDCSVNCANEQLIFHTTDRLEKRVWSQGYTTIDMWTEAMESNLPAAVCGKGVNENTICRSWSQ